VPQTTTAVTVGMLGDMVGYLGKGIQAVGLPARDCCPLGQVRVSGRWLPLGIRGEYVPNTWLLVRLFGNVARAAPLQPGLATLAVSRAKCPKASAI